VFKQMQAHIPRWPGHQYVILYAIGQFATHLNDRWKYPLPIS
jgi:hypothetical protein